MNHRYADIWFQNGGCDQSATNLVCCFLPLVLPSSTSISEVYLDTSTNWLNFYMTTLQILWPSLKLGLTTVSMALCLLCLCTMSTGWLAQAWWWCGNLCSCQPCVQSSTHWQWLTIISGVSVAWSFCLFHPIYHIGWLYLSPSANTNSINSICNLIDQALVQQKQIVVCGDLNAWEHPHTRAMSEYIITRDLHQPIEIQLRSLPTLPLC